jgi:hypothetical protein
MKLKGSIYKYIVTVIFNSGVKEEILCTGYDLKTFEFTGSQYIDYLINPDQVSAFFVKENSFYDETA